MQEERDKDTSFMNGFGDDINHKASELKSLPLTAPVPLPYATGIPDYAAVLAKDRVRPTDEIEQPPACLFIEQDGREYPVASLGDISAITGKAKTKKTFVVSFAVAATVACRLILNRMIGRLPDNQNVVLLFDTEQSRYHVLKLVKRICRLAGIDDPPNLIVYSLRGHPPDQRLGAIDYAIRTTPGVGLVIIDGVRDLAVDPILNGDDASRIMTHLLQWTAEFNIHIMTVLHQNKADRNLRGILGSELVNKSETVIEVSRDEANKEISHVEPKDCRNIEFPAFSFSVGEDGLPYLVEGATLNKATTGDGKRRSAPVDLKPDDIDVMLKRAFAVDCTLRYGELVIAIQEATEHAGYRLTDNKAQGLVKRLVTDGIITKFRGPKQQYPSYQINNENPSIQSP